MAEETHNDLTALAVQLLSAYVSKNSVSSENLADLIKSTRAALAPNAGADVTEPVGETFIPAVSVRKSLASPDRIISLIDGKPYKTLKRHLATHGLTPDQYRARYGLPNTYPLVAQSYSDTRRAVAAKNGLGKKRASAPTANTVAGGDATKSTAANPAVMLAKKGSKAKDVAPPKAEPAAVKKEARRRLSIAGPKGAKADGKAAAMPKSKPASQPKSLKAAMDAASTHLSGNAQAPEES